MSVLTQKGLTHERVIKAGHTLSPILLDKISEADRRWFKKHPDRNYRFRKSMNGEPSGSHMIVQQIEPGFRLRRSIQSTPPHPPDNDESLQRVWDLIDDGKVAVVLEGRVIELAELPNLGGTLQ